MPFPLIAAAIGAAGSIGSSLINKSAADDAAAAARQAAAVQKEAARKAGDAVMKQGKKAVKYLKPYNEAGEGGTNLLADALGINGPEAQAAYFSGFQNDPGYQATLQGGIDAIDQSAAGAGSLRSGGTLKSLMAHGERMQFEQFKDRLDRLKGVSGMGLDAAGKMGDIRLGMGTAKGNALLAGAGAQAGGILGAGTAGMYGAGAMGQGVSDLFGRLSGPLSTYLGNSMGFGGTPVAGNSNMMGMINNGDGTWSDAAGPALL